MSSPRGRCLLSVAEVFCQMSSSDWIRKYSYVQLTHERHQSRLDARSSLLSQACRTVEPYRMEALYAMQMKSNGPKRVFNRVVVVLTEWVLWGACVAQQGRRGASSGPILLEPHLWNNLTHGLYSIRICEHSKFWRAYGRIGHTERRKFGNSSATGIRGFC